MVKAQRRRRHELKSNPLIPEGHGGLGVTNSKILEICQTAGPIVNKFGTRMQIRLHMNGHSWLKKKIAPRDPRGIVEGRLWVTY